MCVCGGGGGGGGERMRHLKFIPGLYLSLFTCCCMLESNDFYISYIPLISLVCSVRTASYGSSFLLSFYGSSAKHAGHENKEGKNEDP